MDFSFRVRMRLPAGALLSLTLDSDRLDLVSDEDSGVMVWIKSMEAEVPLCDARNVALRGSGYGSEVEARSEGELWRNAAQAALARLGFAADFGERTATGGATAEGLKLLAAEAGTVVMNDDPGVLVFRTEANPRFARFEATGTKRPDEARLREALRLAKETGPHHREVETLAFDLYSAPSRRSPRTPAC